MNTGNAHKNLGHARTDGAADRTAVGTIGQSGHTGAVGVQGKNIADQVKPEVATAVADVHAEVERAMAIHGQLQSAHESYAVILEEVDEFWDEVKKRNENRSDQAMRKELVQIAAMAIRAIVDLGLPK